MSAYLMIVFMLLVLQFTTNVFLYILLRENIVMRSVKEYFMYMGRSGIGFGVLNMLYFAVHIVVAVIFKAYILSFFGYL